MKTQFQIFTYENAFKNEEGTWVAETVLNEDLVCNLDVDDISSKEVCEFLECNGIIGTSDLRRLDVFIGKDVIVVTEKKEHYPLCMLRAAQC